MLVLAALYPSACGGTDIEIPPGGPDPNDYGCDSLLFETLDSIDGPVAGTDDNRRGIDVLQTRMMLNASAAAAVPFLLALGTAFYAGGGTSPDSPPATLPRIVRVPYQLAALVAIAAALYAAFAMLNSALALIPLVVPVVAAAFGALSSNRRWVWAAVAFQVAFSAGAAIPIGFLFVPSALLMLFAGGLELVLRVERSAEDSPNASF